MTNQPKDEVFEQWWATTPESKLELIDGQLIISSLAGSRRVAWYLLNDYGPVLALPLAPADLWWAALGQAFQPQPTPQTPAAWSDWAADLDYTPVVAPAGPHGSTEHRRVYGLLRDGLYHLAEVGGLGRMLARDFVIRLGENGLTPDLIFIDQPRLANLHGYYLDGPPALTIEITLAGSAELDRQLKRQLYEQAGLPEYWLIEPARQQIVFHDLETDGHYHAITVDSQGRYQPPANGRPHPVGLDEHSVYHSRVVPGLALSVPRLWSMTEYNWTEPWWPFLPVEPTGAARPTTRRSDSNELGWDSVPFAPRLDLQPTPIQFAEYISWCPEAKFERYGGGLKIGGSEGTRRVLGLLLMTLGLVEGVRLAHPYEWVTFLTKEHYQPIVQPRAEALLQQAHYRSREYRPGEVYFHGEIPGLPEVDAFGESLAECQQELAEAVNNWLLLRIARREAWPE